VRGCGPYGQTRDAVRRESSWTQFRDLLRVSGEIVLLLVYAKAKFDNLRPEFLLKLKERFDEHNQSRG